MLARRLGEIVRFSTDKGSCGSPVMTADNKINLPGKAEFSDPIPKKPQFQKNSYARQLRVVGQALEERHVFSLDLELKRGLYVVRGKITAADYAQSSFQVSFNTSSRESDRFSRPALAGRSMKSICLTNRRR